MSFIDLIHETFSALSANKIRSLLTVLGIVIGISAVIAMTGLVNGIKNAMIGDLGLARARIVYVACWHGDGMKSSDVDAMKLGLSNVYEDITAPSYGSASITDGKNNCEATINGIDAAYEKVMMPKMAQGRWFTAEEIQKNDAKIVLSQNDLKKIFGDPDANALGKEVKLGQTTFKVIGVTESDNMSYGEMASVNVPNGIVMQRFGGTTSLSNIICLAREDADMDSIKTTTEDWLKKHFNITSDDSNEIYVQTMKSIIDEVNSTMLSFQILMTSVASISLLVGGIGIMNMMLTNVTERIREIGLRKALGARPRDITRQFLLESIVLCVISGIIGILGGFALSYGFTSLASQMMYGSGDGGASTTAITPAIDPQAIIAATLICIFIGIVFGYYPARRAAKLDPVESLHYQ